MSLVEVIVGIGLMLVIFASLVGLLRLAFELTTRTRADTVATTLATSQLERLRAAPYDTLGTVEGNPSGTFVSLETRSVQGLQYQIHTHISFRDDVVDGRAQADIDGQPNDYRVVRVAVQYAPYGSPREVVLASTFAETGSVLP